MPVLGTCHAHRMPLPGQPPACCVRAQGGQCDAWWVSRVVSSSQAPQPPPCALPAAGTSTHPWTSWLPCYPAWCSTLGESTSPRLVQGAAQQEGLGLGQLSWPASTLCVILCPILVEGMPWGFPPFPYAYVSAFQIQVCDRDRCWGRSLRAGQVCGEHGVALR